MANAADDLDVPPLIQRLLDGPVTHETGGLRKDGLPPDVRAEIHTIQVPTGTSKGYRDHSNWGGRLTAVSYLAGDLARAINVFVDANRDQLTEIEFTKRNRVKEALSQQHYDRVLEALGEKSIRKYQTTVVEERPDGTTWVFRREDFERNRRRYSTSDTVARLPDGQSLDDVWEALPSRFRAHDLTAIGVEGVVSRVIEFYDDCGLYPVEVAASGQTARKRDSD